MDLPVINQGLTPDIVKRLEDQQYFIVGNHSGVKLCHWTKHDLKNEGSCYKNKFYGINAYRCLQVSPALSWCTERCQFCWRSEGYAYGDDMSNVKLDDPEEVIDGMIHGQQVLLSGYGGHYKVDRSRWEEANKPKHVAISLSGEPTLYPYLDEFIAACHKKGMTTFLVTNGTQPEVLANLNNLPTQLYVTVAGATQRVHSSITRPLNPKWAWDKLMQTIDLLPSLDTRKVIRLTLVKDMNMVEPEMYAKLFMRSEAHFLEAKGFVSVGDARRNIKTDKMPNFEDIVEFSHEIVESVPDLKIIDISAPSCVALMAHDDYSWRKLRFDN